MPKKAAIDVQSENRPLIHLSHLLTETSFTNNDMRIPCSLILLLSAYHVLDRQAIPHAQRPRGCQVIATKNMRLFCHENGLKPHISV